MRTVELEVQEARTAIRGANLRVELLQIKSVQSVQFRFN